MARLPATVTVKLRIEVNERRAAKWRVRALLRAAALLGVPLDIEATTEVSE